MSTEANIKVTLATLAPLSQTIVDTESLLGKGGGNQKQMWWFSFPNLDKDFFFKNQGKKGSDGCTLPHSYQKLQYFGLLIAYFQQGRKNVFL